MQTKYLFISVYKKIEDSSIPCDFVRSVSECESAAQKLGLSDLSADIFDESRISNMDHYHLNQYPPFCFFSYFTGLWFSTIPTIGPCSRINTCICRENDFCAKIPCGEGQGDCDNDTECEGSLVCGHMNCLNNNFTDCCTQPCNDDSDCPNQECNTEISKCRLDSYNTDWSKCSLDSPCAAGEGDCDHDADCEGTLFCGNDNCENRTAGMDCCVDDGNIIRKIFHLYNLNHILNTFL